MNTFLKRRSQKLDEEGETGGGREGDRAGGEIQIRLVVGGGGGGGGVKIGLVRDIELGDIKIGVEKGNKVGGGIQIEWRDIDIDMVGGSGGWGWLGINRIGVEI